MNRFIYLVLGFLFVSSSHIYAQGKEKEPLNNLDSLITGRQNTQKNVAQMPVHNPRKKDAKLMILKPKGWISNMPIVGKQDSLSTEGLPNSGKNPFKNIPGDINED